MVDVPEGWAQQQYNELAARVRAAGAPITAENMNRAQLMMAQEQRGATPEISDFDMAMERAASSTPRGRGSRDSRSGGRRNNNEPLPTPPEQAPMPNEQAMAEGASLPDTMMSPRAEPPRTAGTRGAQIAAGDLQGRRPGTVNTGRYYDEGEAEGQTTLGSIPNVQPPRQADETGVDQLGLLSAIIAPLLAGAGGVAGAAGRGLPGGAAGNLGVTLRNAMAGRLGGPGAGGASGMPPAAPAIAGGGGVPALPGSGGAAAMRQLPAPTAATSNAAPRGLTWPQEQAQIGMAGPIAGQARNAGRGGLIERLRQRNYPNAE